ncbi:MAG: 1-deoxy-D-xylulose-5-phosphate synthase [Candidatus Azotimanducaceae bacterium]|uniref:1-deoxy-D-xylulose-5-phosphate synthase n=1 Tax=OM182 bacterium TaxID=2510334 RepID=A0A520S2R4_9GAMM|nr:1-deoxy-D-xylulose-5-phosphate synthase [Gammaproteobacteria bacterium]OUV68599.1 MAG: 1-deoxy-D-xylulose-5-phosphate synthase [Gammaproteobacteria bacterium TMED133]RZO76763.1 MAG: 1-deoxy-D-xylulose-5-phosphate synthase [OM182 bacterium]
MFQTIPTQRPSTPLLDTIQNPSDIRDLEEKSLGQLSTELRHFLIYIVGQTGGHFGAGLGVVELTLALHYVFNTPDDQIVWDVGHQAYPHKILTGRRDRMHTLRRPDGIAPFPVRDESQYDTFGVGHSSTSISAALGIAIASRMRHKDNRAVAVIGDGAMTAGLAFEALNHVSDTEANLLVILNDNAMSISHNVGGLSKYFARILSSRLYLSMREGSKKILSRIPHAWEFARKTEEHMKGMVVPGTLFEELGFNYIGPIDGHDLKSLVSTLNNIKDLKGPQFLHIVTKKGKGYGPAEASPVGSHSLSKIEKKAPRQSNMPTYSNIFGDWICDMAKKDEMLVGITPAMCEGSDLIAFSEQFPERYYDVGIAEQHAVTLAAGLASQGVKPVVAIYSTFLQRAYDQVIHDIAIQKLNVLFAIDRAGLLEDGPTHSGVFDLSFMRCIPNLVVMTPSDENEAWQMLHCGYLYNGPASVRYPRGTGPGQTIQKAEVEISIGKAKVITKGTRVAILAFGSMVQSAKAATKNLSASLIDMRFVKPIDIEIILEMAATHSLIVTIEENVLAGGAGSAVNEVIQNHQIDIEILNLGVLDTFIQQDKPAKMLQECGLDEAGILKSIEKRLEASSIEAANTN